jgi:hypothetical protein
VIKRLTLIAAVLAPAVLCQEWEAGGLGGFTITRDSDVSRTTGGTASTGFKNGFVFGAYAGSNDYRYLSGEASYLYGASDLRLSSGGREVTFGANEQYLDFRLLIHFAKRESRFRPFVAVGGGVAVYSGTGADNAAQPLNSYAALSHTRETKPMVSGAAGVKFRISDHVGLRFEFRDYSTPFPNRVIAPAPGSSISGWVNHFVPLAGIGGVF